MANWQGVNQALTQGYEIGRSTGGGRVAALGAGIKRIADRLRQERETKEETQKNILGTIQGEQIKRMINPPEWKPTTKEEATEFEGAKNRPKPFELEKEAGDEAFKQMGGSLMSGIGTDTDSTQKYVDLKNKIYQSYLEQFGYSIPQSNVQENNNDVSIPTPKMPLKANQQNSPFEEYPDAFQESGVWKVVRNGKKYRIEQ